MWRRRRLPQRGHLFRGRVRVRIGMDRKSLPDARGTVHIDVVRKRWDLRRSHGNLPVSDRMGRRAVSNRQRFFLLFIFLVFLVQFRYFWRKRQWLVFGCFDEWWRRRLRTRTGSGASSGLHL